MAKVLGVILSIVGGLAFLGKFFVYLNSSVVLPYNPADGFKGLIDVDLSFSFVIFGFMLLCGLLLLKLSSEPNLK
tara:strand:- start:272 stop:496 length:225 start_codon:yes stop_codon:yes gene_type:complete